MREGDLLGTVARACPQDSLPVLRQTVRGKVRNAIYAARDPFQFSPLREPGEDRVGNAERAGLGCGHQAIILLSQGK